MRAGRRGLVPADSTDDGDHRLRPFGIEERQDGRISLRKLRILSRELVGFVLPIDSFRRTLGIGEPCADVICAAVRSERYRHSEDSSLHTNRAAAYVQRGPVANFRFSEQYREREIQLEENSAEDIRELAVEMLERTTSGNQYTEDDEVLQTRFRRLFLEGHYSFGSTGRVGRSFLRKYEHLID